MASRMTSVLLVEDSVGEARLVREFLLDAATPGFELAYARTLAECLAKIAESDFDGVLLDLNLPDSQGLATFHSVHETAPTTAIVVLTGLSDDDLGEKAIQDGAQDYIVKKTVDPDSLTRSLRYAVDRKRAELQLKSVVEESARLRLLNETSLALSHHIRNALTPIALLATGVDPDDRSQARELKRLATHASNRVSAIVDSMVELAESGRVPTVHALDDGSARMLDLEALIEKHLRRAQTE